VRAVLDRPGRGGRVVLVATTVRGTASRTVAIGSPAAAITRTFPRRVRVAPGIYRATREGLHLIGVRHGRVRFLAVASRTILRRSVALRRAVRRAGL
jgi:hypothetical protein